jgi:1-phosphofructokinase family hexose kinase
MLIVGPNLTVDRMIGVNRFDLGHIHRADRVETWIGGGGANAGRAARRLGARAHLMTLLPPANAADVVEALAHFQISVEWVPCRGNLRVATILREEEGRMSILHEPGPTVTPTEWEEFERRVVARINPGEALLCSGSLPPGAPVNGYARLAHEARHAGARCVIDVGGSALASLLEDGVGLITPNLTEAESLLYGERAEPVYAEETSERARAAANGLLRAGASRAVVTAGGAGAAYAQQGPDGGSGWVDAPTVDARNPIGAGDTFATGLGLRLESGAPLRGAVAFAAAVAAAHVESANGDFEPARAEELLTSPAAGSAA